MADIHLDISEIMQRSQLMTSKEADLEARTWTFEAPYFQASAGEYVVIAQHDWEKFLHCVRTAHSAPVE